MAPLEYCREKTRASGSSFLMGFAFLSAAQREAMLVLYAFCREVDDVVDECSDISVAEKTLEWWCGQLDRVYAEGTMPDHPVCQAMMPIVKDFSLPKEEFLAIIDGMKMDLTIGRYATFSDLARYCQLVAGVVGRLIVRILSFKNEQTLLYADKLGLALQLTNIIRDVGEDARRARIYLPQEDLVQLGVSEKQILSHQTDSNFELLMNFQIKRALSIYKEAIELLPAKDRKTQRAGLVMGAIYYDLLKTIECDDVGKLLAQKISLSSSRKAIVAFKTLLLGFRP